MMDLSDWAITTAERHAAPDMLDLSEAFCLRSSAWTNSARGDVDWADRLDRLADAAWNVETTEARS